MRALNMHAALSVPLWHETEIPKNMELQVLQYVN